MHDEDAAGSSAGAEAPSRPLTEASDHAGSAAPAVGTQTRIASGVGDGTRPGFPGPQSADALAAEVAQLKEALESRTEIGIAIGILVQRHGWTSGVAFDWLVALSQRTNVRILTIARDIVHDANTRARE